MSKLLASGLASAIAMAAVAVGAAPARTTQAEAAAPVAMQTELVMSALDGVPLDALPAQGECRIWYDDLPATHQPAQMDCEHADWLAQRWGGRVIAMTDSGEAQLAAYDGRNDFAGVPAEALPRRGYCRVWIEGVVASDQPAQSDCRTARSLATAQGGRVLFMPL